jgi:chitinase
MISQFRYRRDYEEGFESVLVAEAVDFWLESGMPSEKLIFGLPSYGRTWRLQDSTKTDLLSPAIGAGPLGPYTGQDGFISLYEMCLYQQSGWTVVTDPTGKMGPYGYSATTWASWDDIDMTIIKVKYAMSKNLGGIMFWELSLDDFLGVCSMGPRYKLKCWF